MHLRCVFTSSKGRTIRYPGGGWEVLRKKNHPRTWSEKKNTLPPHPPIGKGTNHPPVLKKKEKEKKRKRKEKNWKTWKLEKIITESVKKKVALKHGKEKNGKRQAF